MTGPPTIGLYEADILLSYQKLFSLETLYIQKIYSICYNITILLFSVPSKWMRKMIVFRRKLVILSLILEVSKRQNLKINQAVRLERKLFKKLAGEGGPI